ncbi:MAG TPA: nucleotidyl transferase AbiEii/AbiGii toxin family protein [Candidatus Nanoarchaeia archaeon]|nr:nucleotidyl transferase AbiEii/AbiGii toxin family protein [Candidatus Nanoarchaeia archaeon]
MNQLQLREKEIFETLKAIKDFEFVVIGGYAVNAYALPRFSVDCDIVIKDDESLKGITNELSKLGYKEADKASNDIPYHGKFFRYEKTVIENFKVSIDILFEEVLDRQTNAVFNAEWIFDNSKINNLKGKTITEKLKIRIINLSALIVMKIISCRSTDIRDIFMLTIKAKDIEWIKKEISFRYDFKDRFDKIEEKITSDKFRNDLQGVHGYIEQKTFDKHKKAVLKIDK